MKANTQFASGSDSHRYLLIAGVPKAATTSLFRYLADHPEICQANRKETYFFARDFDDKQVCTGAETIETFQTYFAHCQDPDKLRLEATPYTLYNKNAAQKILAMLPQARILVILRDPVSRLFSDFRFQQQRAIPSVQQTSFESYVEHLIANQTDQLDQLGVGRYIDYLQPFYDCFGESRILVLFYEDFKERLVSEMCNLCESLGIDGEFYRHYHFDIHNQTINVRYNWLNQLRLNLEPHVAGIRAKAIHNNAIHHLFEKIIDVGRFTIDRVNDRGKTEIPVPSPEARTLLLEYYRPYNEALATKLRRALPDLWYRNEPQSKDYQGVTYANHAKFTFF